MEFASELVVKGRRSPAGASAEVPTTLDPDHRPTAPSAQLRRRLAAPALAAPLRPRWLFLYPASPCSRSAWP